MHSDEQTDIGAGPAARRQPYLSLCLESSPASVRAALGEVSFRLGQLALGCRLRGDVELVVAEVLNNICEHAYAASAEGRIDLSIWVESDAVDVEVRDAGSSMPGGVLPEGRRVAVTGPAGTLPEGGFGWHLIRQVASDLSYARIGGTNRLTFRVCPDARQPKGARTEAG